MQEAIQHIDYIKKLVSRWHPITHEHDDLVQDVFVTIARGSSYAGRSCYKTWLYRVVKNLVAYNYRRRKIKEVRKQDFEQCIRCCRSGIDSTIETLIETKEIVEKIMNSKKLNADDKMLFEEVVLNDSRIPHGTPKYQRWDCARSKIKNLRFMQ